MSLLCLLRLYVSHCSVSAWVSISLCVFSFLPLADFDRASLPLSTNTKEVPLGKVRKNDGRFFFSYDWSSEMELSHERSPVAHLGGRFVLEEILANRLWCAKGGLREKEKRWLVWYTLFCSIPLFSSVSLLLPFSVALCLSFSSSVCSSSFLFFPYAFSLQGLFWLFFSLLPLVNILSYTDLRPKVSAILLSSFSIVYVSYRSTTASPLRSKILKATKKTNKRDQISEGQCLNLFGKYVWFSRRLFLSTLQTAPIPPHRSESLPKQADITKKTSKKKK